MTSTHNDTHATWAQIVLFQVYKLYPAPGVAENISVFANGRQQCRIHVDFDARDANGNPVTLSPDDIRNHVKLIDYQTGQPLGGDWTTSFTDSGYEWDENLISEVLAQQDGRAWKTADTSPQTPIVTSRPSAVQSVTFHVSSKTARTLSIGAQIGFPGQPTPAQTNHRQVELNRPEGDGAGQFNSFVVARATAFPSLSEQNYGDRDSQGLRMEAVGNENNIFRARQFYINVNFNGRRLGLKSVSGSAQEKKGFSAYKYASILDQWKWAVSYYGQPGASSPENLPLSPLGYIDIAVRGTRVTEGDAHGMVERIAHNAISCITRIALEAIGVIRGGRGEHVDGVERDAGTHLRKDFMTMFNECVGQIVGPRSDSVVVGVLTGNIAGRFKTATGLETPEVPSANLYLMDVYGNEHALAIGFDRLPQLTLRKA